VNDEFGVLNAFLQKLPDALAAGRESPFCPFIRVKTAGLKEPFKPFTGKVCIVKFHQNLLGQVLKKWQAIQGLDRQNYVGLLKHN
jgi:hypothetical protein